MSFFDDFGKKLSEVGQNAVKKTREITDSAKINSAISEENQKIANNYYQIGKLYVEKHASDCEPDFAGMIAAIRESEQKVADYTRQIQELKGLVRCEKCGAQVPGNMPYCNFCGTPLPQPPAAAGENLSKCPRCGQMIPNTMKFCTYCGNPMGNAPQPQAPVPPPAGQPAGGPQPVAPQPAVSQPVAPQPAVAQPVAPQPVAPQPAVAQPVAPHPVAPQPAVSQPVASQPVAPQPVAPQPVAPQPAAPQTTGKKCPRCGEEMAEDLAYCTECGTKL